MDAGTNTILTSMDGLGQYWGTALTLISSWQTTLVGVLDAHPNDSGDTAL